LPPLDPVFDLDLKDERRAGWLLSGSEDGELIAALLRAHFHSIPLSKRFEFALFNACQLVPSRFSQKARREQGRGGKDDEVSLSRSKIGMNGLS
jgi:hypothetical protein